MKVYNYSSLYSMNDQKIHTAIKSCTDVQSSESEGCIRRPHILSLIRLSEYVCVNLTETGGLGRTVYATQANTTDVLPVPPRYRRTVI